MSPKVQEKSVHPLKQYREARLLSQQELADASGVAVRTISTIETGAHSPRIETRRKLLAALHIEQSKHKEVFGDLAN